MDARLSMHRHCGVSRPRARACAGSSTRSSVLALGLSIGLACIGAAEAGAQTIVSGDLLASSELDTATRTITHYEPDGTLLATLSVPGLSSNSDIRGIASGIEGLIYAVVDQLPSESELVTIALDGSIVASLPLPDVVGGNTALGKLAVRGGNAYVAGTPGLYEIDIGTGDVTLLYPEGRVFDFAALPNGNWLVAERGNIYEISATTGARLRTIELSDPTDLTGISGFSADDITINGLEYSEPLDRLFVSTAGGPGPLLVFGYTTGELQQIGDFPGADDMFIDRDGRLLIGSGSATPWIVRPDDLSLIGRMGSGARRFVSRFEPPAVVTPSAFSDTVVDVVPGTPVLIDVLSNDFGFGDSVTVTVDVPPENGIVRVLGSPGDRRAVRIEYTASVGFAGDDVFRYIVDDGVASDTATVRVSVVSTKAFDDTFVTIPRLTSTIDVLANDFGFSGELTVSANQPDAGGRVRVFNSPGPADDIAVTYTSACCNPVPYTETFEYSVSNGVNTDFATVTVNVVSAIAQDDSAVANIGTTVDIPIAANDLGFLFDATVNLLSIPANGTVLINSPWPFNDSRFAVSYTPNPGFLGTDSFQYVVEDSATFDIATVTVEVTLDADLDLVGDADDNCIEAENPDQRDSDNDGFGNACDADLNNDGFINFVDLGIFRSRFASNDPDADFNGDGLVSFADLAVLRASFGKAPGPSANAP